MTTRVAERRMYFKKMPQEKKVYIRALFSFLFMSKSLKDGSQSSEILKGFSGGTGLPQAKDDWLGILLNFVRDTCILPCFIRSFFIFATLTAGIASCVSKRVFSIFLSRVFRASAAELTGPHSPPVSKAFNFFNGVYILGILILRKLGKLAPQ